MRLKEFSAVFKMIIATILPVIKGRQNKEGYKSYMML